MTSGKDSSIGRHDLPLRTTTSKLQLKYRTTKLKTIRNQVKWKSDEYRIKETTSIQTSRRGADVEQAGQTPTYGG